VGLSFESFEVEYSVYIRDERRTYLDALWGTPDYNLGPRHLEESIG